MTRLKQIRDVKRPPAKVTPTRTGSTINGQASGTSLAVTVPVTAGTGDIAYFALVVTDTTTVTTPGGVVLLASYSFDGNGNKLVLYIATLAAGSGGVVINFPLSTNNAAVGGCITFAGAGGYSVVPQVYYSTSTEAANNRPPRFPSAVAGPKDLMFGIAATGAYASLAANAPLMTAAPAGMTIRQAQAVQNNTLTLGRGLAFVDGPGHALQSETYTTTQAVHSVAVMMVLSPVAPRWSEIERKPPSLGNIVHVYGSSSSAFVKRPEVNWGYCTRTPWGKRVQSLFGGGGASVNYSMPGARSADVCTFIYGTASRSTEAVAGDPLAVARTGTWNPASTASAVLIDGWGNDILALGGSAQALTGAENSADAIARLIRCGTAISHGDAAVVKTGTWTAPASNGLMFGACAQTTVPGSRWTLTVTDKPTVDLVLVGGDNTALGNTGSTFRVLLDGVQIATGTTHNQMKETNYGAGTNYRFAQMCVPVTGIPAGTHTIAVEHTGSSGHILQVNGALIPKATPPVVVLVCLHRNTTAESTYGYSWTDQQAYHARLHTVASRFPDGRVIVYDPNASGRWDQSTMVVSDFVHQNELGHALYAYEITRALNERIP